MGGEKKIKKKCCGKFKKKGKHCSSCPLSGATGKCKPEKEYCKDCESSTVKKTKKDKKKKDKGSKKKG